MSAKSCISQRERVFEVSVGCCQRNLYSIKLKNQCWLREFRELKFTLYEICAKSKLSFQFISWHIRRWPSFTWWKIVLWDIFWELNCPNNPNVTCNIVLKCYNGGDPANFHTRFHKRDYFTNMVICSGELEFGIGVGLVRIQNLLKTIIFSNLPWMRGGRVSV